MTDEVVAAVKAGKTVILPTDTVYGLCADAYREGPVRRLYTLKQRPETMPTAMLAADLEAILDAIPELRGRAAVMARALLPGPYTLVLPNPGRRFRWLERYAAGHDRSSRPGSARGVPRRSRARRGRGGDERERPRRPRPGSHR